MVTIPTVKRGQRFAHPYRLDTGWRPNVAAGEKYADAPHAECVVTRVARGQVYYSDADGRGRFTSPLTALLDSGVVFRD
jgi:hypothetical protein